jgi:hypothetical protein
MRRAGRLLATEHSPARSAATRRWPIVCAGHGEGLWPRVERGPASPEPAQRVDRMPHSLLPRKGRSKRLARASPGGIAHRLSPIPRRQQRDLDNHDDPPCHHPAHDRDERTAQQNRRCPGQKSRCPFLVPRQCQSTCQQRQGEECADAGGHVLQPADCPSPRPRQPPACVQLHQQMPALKCFPTLGAASVRQTAQRVTALQAMHGIRLLRERLRVNVHAPGQGPHANRPATEPPAQRVEHHRSVSPRPLRGTLRWQNDERRSAQHAVVAAVPTGMWRSNCRRRTGRGRPLFAPSSSLRDRRGRTLALSGPQRLPYTSACRSPTEPFNCSDCACNCSAAEAACSEPAAVAWVTLSICATARLICSTPRAC